jgi:hypothetical protein
VNEIAATQVLGPDQLLSADSPVVSATAAGGNLVLSWPVAAAGYTVLATTNLAGGGWTPVAAPPQIFGDQWQVSQPLANSAQYFRLQR